MTWQRGFFAHAKPAVLISMTNFRFPSPNGHVTTWMTGRGTVSAGDLDQKTEAVPGAPVPQVSWVGLYAGANGGYGLSARQPDMGIVDLSTNSIDRLDAAQSGGGFGGIQAGYSWQGLLDPGLVLGIEGDLEYAGIGGTLKGAPAAPFEAQATLNFWDAERPCGLRLGSHAFLRDGGLEDASVHKLLMRVRHLLQPQSALLDQPIRSRVVENMAASV